MGHKDFPLSEFEVRHMMLTDPWVHALATFLDHVEQECHVPNNSARAALIVHTLYETGALKPTPFERYEAVRQVMFNAYKLMVAPDEPV